MGMADEVSGNTAKGAQKGVKSSPSKAAPVTSYNICYVKYVYRK
jgi:hypothetical protein